MKFYKEKQNEHFLILTVVSNKYLPSYNLHIYNMYQ